MKKIALTSALVLPLALMTLVVGCSQNDPSSSVTASDDSANVLQSGNVLGRNLDMRGTKRLVLTFDDGPFPTVTPQLLDYLRNENIKASFFLQGSQIPGQERLLERMRNEGHEIGNHTQHHRGLIGLSRQDWGLVYNELAQTDRLIAPYTGAQNHQYFRAPGGSWCPQHADQMNMHPNLTRYIGPIYWDAGGDLIYVQPNGTRATSPATSDIWAAADHACWSTRTSVEACTQAYLREIERVQGGIVLMHDRNVKTYEMVRMMVPELRRRGYTFVKLEDLPQMNRFVDRVTMTSPAAGACRRP